MTTPDEPRTDDAGGAAPDAPRPDAAAPESPAQDGAAPETPAPETPAESATADVTPAETPSAPEAAGAEVPAADAPDEEAAARAPVNLEELARTLEALLFAAEEPIAVRELARAAGSDSATVRKVLPRIQAAYAEQRTPWDLVEVAGGYRLATRPEFYPAIQRLKTQTAQRKLTQAALETLALIAYRQPIGRAEVESVRGVGAGPVLRLLLEKKLIKIAGRGTGLGQPLLYGTTGYFLEHFGLKSLEELPKLGDFKGA